MKTLPATSPPTGTAKVEFLYFESCPGHKQALANLKAALQESKIRADLVLINVTSEAQAAKVGFQGSPSIRVNQKDLDGRDVRSCLRLSHLSNRGENHSHAHKGIH